MIGKSDVWTRRTLTFPAVRPCEAVSPATLLDSLIVLACNICEFRSGFFSNKRNVRESIRLVGLLLAFLEEIREGRCNFSDSVVLALSELHFIFQKLQFLLEDCARRGAQLWMLVNCERTAEQFRVLMRAVSTALDVLPFNSIDVPVEARESVELAMKQARKSRFETDAEDKLASETVCLTLQQFEEGIVPKRNDLRQVLDQLGIRSWSECQREIKFLESEMNLEYSSLEKRDLALLSDLIALMSYCRGALFDVVDKVAVQQSTNRCSSDSDVFRHLNPDDFRCPISLEIMADPVTVTTGHTYDRPSILRWFRAGHRTCPKTGEKLPRTDLTPNLALKQLISRYCHENGIPFAEKDGKNRDITRTVVAGSVAAEAAMKALASFFFVRLATGADQERNKAAFEIRLLTKASIFNRSCLAEAGTIPHLLNLISSSNSSTQENAMAALLNLSKHSKSKAIIVENGGVESILRVLKEGLKVEARQHAAGTLFYLASVEGYRALIGETPAAIPALMELLRDGTDRGKKNALVAIFGLLMYPDNHWRVLSAGLVPLLASRLKNFRREDLTTDSLAVLATLAEKHEGTMAIIGSGVLPVIVEILCSTISKAGKEFCVSLLLALCINCKGEVVPLLAKNPSLTGQLYSVLSGDTSLASRKASSLIRILLEFQEKSSSSLMGPAFPQEQFVHVW